MRQDRLFLALLQLHRDRRRNKHSYHSYLRQSVQLEYRNLRNHQQTIHQSK